MTIQQHTKQIDSKMYFIETAVWKKGEVIMTVAVGEADQPKSPVGYISLERYDDNQKPVFSSRDLEGHVLFESTVNLYQLKRRFRDNEAELTQAMEEHEISREALLEDLRERALLEEEPEHDERTHNDIALDQPTEDTDNSADEKNSRTQKQPEMKVVHRKNSKEKNNSIGR